MSSSPCSERRTEGVVIVNDGCELSYSLWVPEGPRPTATVVLVHGWSASRRSFDPVIPGLLKAGCRVLAYDQRWHGESSSSSSGGKRSEAGGGSSSSSPDDPGACHCARLAVDLEGVLDAVFGGSEEEQGLQVTCVGTSLGAAVLWSHYELFQGGGARGRGATTTATTATKAAAAKTSNPLPPPRIHRVMYVDQAPLQNRTSDWSLGSKGCYDAATLAGLQAAVRDAAADGGSAFARGNAEACLAMPIPKQLDELLASETNKANREALARLMADHTQGDWRAVIRGLEGQQALVVAGSESKIFPVEGCLWVAENAPRAKSVVFKGCGHWLYVERPDEFAELVARFASKGLEAVEGGEV